MRRLAELHRRWGLALWVSLALHGLAVWLLLQAHLLDPEDRETEVPPVLEVALVDYRTPEPKPKPEPEPEQEQPEVIDLPPPEALPLVSVPARERAAPTPQASVPQQTTEPEPDAQKAPESRRDWTALIRRNAIRISKEKPYAGTPSHLAMPGENPIPLTGGSVPDIFKGDWAPEEVEVEHLGEQDGIQRAVMRLPNGTELCGDRRVPDASDSFDISIFVWREC